MRHLMVGTLLGVLAFAAITPPVFAQETQKSQKVLKGQPIKDGEALGTEVSTVTSYDAQREGGGIVRNCWGRCSSGTELRWQCKLIPEAIAVHCHIHCSPPPAEGECLYE